MKLSQKELEKYYTDNKFMIWQYKTLYQISYSQNAGFGMRQIFKHPKSKEIGVTLRGRYQAMTIKEGNSYL